MWLQTFKQPAGQMDRWLQKLQEYYFTIVHRLGRQHVNAEGYYVANVEEILMGWTRLSVPCRCWIIS